jgi:IS5 family transposase
MADPKCLHCDGWGCTRCEPFRLHRTGCNCADCRGDSKLTREAQRQAKVLGDLAPSEAELRRERGGR